jgi:hypothetical protein
MKKASAFGVTEDSSSSAKNGTYRSNKKTGITYNTLSMAFVNSNKEI